MGIENLIDEVLGGGIHPPASRGARISTRISYVRDLEESDIQALWNLKPGDLESATPILKSIKSSHHMLARCLADGKSGEEAAIITGYSTSRISILQLDPAFKQLVAYYKQQVERCFVNVYERLAALGIDSIEELQKRLDEEPENFTLSQLMDLAELTLDRSGSGPTSKTQNLVALVDARQLDIIKDEIKRREIGTITQVDSGPKARELSIITVAEDPPAREIREGDDV
jgi:hypothetical protein